MGGLCYGDTEKIKHFRAQKSYGLKGKHRFVEVRYDHGTEHMAPEERTIDEVCTEQVHLEVMDDDAVWMDVCGFHVWFHAERIKGTRKLRILVTGSPSMAKPYVLPVGEGTLEKHFAKWDVQRFVESEEAP